MGRISLRAASAVAAVVVTLVGPSCSGGGGDTGPTAPTIAKTSTASGDGQTAQVGTLLPNPLRVLVTLSSAPQAGKTVTWAATGTGASVNPTTSVTDASGIATTAWTLGTAAGAQSATATLAGATGSPVTFTATASAAPVPVIQMTASASGNAQSGGVTTTLPNPLRVLVTFNGAAQAGDTVAWATSGAGSTVTPTTSVTDASGIATTTWKLGQVAGGQAATASLTGATGSPVTFTATAAPGAATQLLLSAGNNQSALAGGAFANPLSVLVADQFNNGVAGDTVAWAVTSGSATVSPPKSASSASGIAQATLTAGVTVGPITITATHAGLTGSPVSFGANVVAAPLTASVNIGDDFFKSVANASQNPAVDTIAVGGTVTWTWTGTINHSVQSTGSPSFTSSSIKASGTYSFTFSSAGTYTYDCAVHGTAMTGTIVVE